VQDHEMLLDKSLACCCGQGTPGVFHHTATLFLLPSIAYTITNQNSFLNAQLLNTLRLPLIKKKKKKKKKKDAASSIQYL
jgi:hypothetical protein